MKSFCIKTNNECILDYLLKEFENLPLTDTYFVKSEFCHYKNVIIHHTGQEEKQFFALLAGVLSRCVIAFYEENIILSLIRLNYFYFDALEQETILQNTIDLLSGPEEEFIVRKEYLYIAILSYLLENKSFLFDGFVNFRLAKYKEVLDYSIDIAVNQFIIEREYSEFIHLLKLYIRSKESEIDLVHVIYANGEAILLDKNKNTISICDNAFNAKYLSDITFSANDYALNTLLTLIPEKIVVHLIDLEDEFVNTLKLIFDDRIKICTECNLCRTYRLITNKDVSKTH